MQVQISSSQLTPAIPWCVSCVITRQHTGRPGHCCSGLGGLANCLLYVCLSAPQINVAWLERGLSVDNPIIFSEPGPLNSLLPGQMWRSPVRCSRVTKGWPDQRCFNKASNVCLFVMGAGWNPLRGPCLGACIWRLMKANCSIAPSNAPAGWGIWGKRMHIPWQTGHHWGSHLWGSTFKCYKRLMRWEHPKCEAWIAHHAPVIASNKGINHSTPLIWTPTRCLLKSLKNS